MKNIIVIAVLILSSLLLVGCNGKYQKVAVEFKHEENYLSGSLVVPEDRSGPFPIVVFVHGDGALPYDAYGYYRPLWNRLAEQGIASFSWDKPGVGSSQGDWENQSMDDRADEVIAAIEMLKKRTDIAPGKIGLIGFSQAGWVLPLVASKSDYPDFMIVVSGAINWMDQGAYLTETRLAHEGFSDEKIKEAISDFRDSSNKFFSPSFTYDEYFQYYHNNAVLRESSGEPMSLQRFRFVKLNWRYDARESLKDIKGPTLAIFGDQDLNVNVSESVRIYKEIFEESGNRNLTIKVFSGAQHGLLKNKYFTEIVPGIGFIVKLEILGDDAFTDGFLDFVVNWVDEKSGS